MGLEIERLVRRERGREGGGRREGKRGRGTERGEREGGGRERERARGGGTDREGERVRSHFSHCVQESEQPSPFLHDALSLKDLVLLGEIIDKLNPATQHQVSGLC